MSQENNQNQQRSSSKSLQFVLYCTEKYLQFGFGDVNYQMMVDDMRHLTGASFACINIFDESGRRSTTRAVSGIPATLQTLLDMLDFQLVGRKWDVLPQKIKRIHQKGPVKYPGLYELGFGHVPHPIADLIEKTFHLGEVYALEIGREANVLGEFALAMPQGKTIEDPFSARLLSQKMALVLMRLKAEKEVIGKDKVLSSITDNMLDMISIVDANGTVQYISPSNKEVLGYDAEEMVGKNVFDFLHPGDRERIKQAFNKGIEAQTPGGEEFRFLDKWGEYRWLEAVGNPLLEKEEIGGAVFGSRDISLRKKAEAELQRANEALKKEVAERKRIENEHRAVAEEYEKVFNGTQDAMFLVEVTDRGAFRYMRNNEAHRIKTGFTTEKIRGKTPQELLGEKNGRVLESNYLRCLRAGTPISFEETLHLPVGERIWATTLTPVFQEGRAAFIVGSSQDITERKRAEEKIRYMSFHDSLTGLYNRAYLEEEMQRLDTERQLPISTIMADLNGLKLVNDTYGHSLGDEMLRRAAEILKNSCRKEDILGRWGGDEFVILLPLTSAREAEAICKRITGKCAEVYVGDVPISISLGTAIKESAEKDLAENLKEAEDNMYKQKLAESRSTRSTVLNTLLKALEAKSFETETHIRRMQELAGRISEKLELPGTERNRLHLLITLHDIGKINIPEKILSKKGPLTAQEWEIMKKHPETGYRIARATEDFGHVAEEILAHHENWDGSGYPKGLKEKEIPLLARIMNILDAFEVITSGRPYKKALNLEEAADELNKGAGTQFDPELVGVFLSTVREDSDKNSCSLLHRPVWE